VGVVELVLDDAVLEAVDVAGVEFEAVSVTVTSTTSGSSAHPARASNDTAARARR